MTTETKHTAGPWAVLQEECDKPYIRVRAALEMAREYASTALDEEREKFMGYEDIGMVASIQADLDSITDSLAALAEIERELDDERRKAAGFKWLLDQQRGVVEELHNAALTPPPVVEVTDETAYELHQALHNARSEYIRKTPDPLPWYWDMAAWIYAVQQVLGQTLGRDAEIAALRARVAELEKLVERAFSEAASQFDPDWDHFLWLRSDARKALRADK